MLRCLQAAMPPVPSRQQMAQAQALQAKALGGSSAAAATIAPAASLSTAPSSRAGSHAWTSVQAFARLLSQKVVYACPRPDAGHVLRRARCNQQPASWRRWWDSKAACRSDNTSCQRARTSFARHAAERLTSWCTALLPSTTVGTALHDSA